MKHYDDMDADRGVFAYVWRPAYDVVPVHQLDGTMAIQKIKPPPGRLFLALVRPYRKPDDLSIEGALLNWNWADGDADLRPVDQEERYDGPVW